MLLYEFLPALETKKKVCNCRAIYDILLYMLLYKLLPSLVAIKYIRNLVFLGNTTCYFINFYPLFFSLKKKKLIKINKNKNLQLALEAIK